LHLHALPAAPGAFIAQKTLSGDYKATTVINTNKTTASAGIAAIGDQENIVTVMYSNGKVSIVQVKRGKETELASTPVDARKKLYLRMQAREGKLFLFSYSTNGKHYTLLNKEPVNGTFLPPWDRAVRVGLVAKGASEQVGVFDNFRLENEHSR
jgi:xylan 1,4-beta-xylosidase